MYTLLIRYDGRDAAHLCKDGDEFLFSYLPEYVNHEGNLPLSHTLPLALTSLRSRKLFSFFEGLASQGWMRSAHSEISKISRDDTFRLLAKNGLDLVGAVEVIDVDAINPVPQPRPFSVESTKFKAFGRCPLCMQSSENTHHVKCAKKLFFSHELPFIPLNTNDFDVRLYSAIHRMSLSGMQVKVGALLKDGRLQPTTLGSRYIIKPPIRQHPTSAINELLSMRICELMLGKKEVAPCGLVPLGDGELVYVTKRFDRKGKKKIHQEDLCQLTGISQFEGSYELVAKTIRKACGGNLAPVSSFLRHLLVQFYIGNSDYHLKNISLQHIDEKGCYRGLSPIYDALSEEALLRSSMTTNAEMSVQFFADDYDTLLFLEQGHSSYETFHELYCRLGVPVKILDKMIATIIKNHAQARALVDASFLPVDKKEDYLFVIDDRLNKIQKGKSSA